MDGFGSVTWWGFSPALNLEEEWASHTRLNECKEGCPLNVLLVGGGDLRHVLTTLPSSRRPLHFFLAESCLEIYARHMLFLKLLTEPKDQFGLQKKVEFFLELYGNSLLRAQTAEYLKESTSHLIQLVTDTDYQKSVLPILDLSALKFKERDFLEGIFKFWRHSHPFSMEDLWDARLRNYLSGRYDSKQGVFDWDYHMKLQEMAPLISSQEYKIWRETGVAFKLRDDAPYQVPNRTMASGLLLRDASGGDTVARRGYWGDIISSPYLAFGISTSHKELLKKEGGRYTKSSVQVSEHTLSQLISGLVAGSGLVTGVSRSGSDWESGSSSSNYHKENGIKSSVVCQERSDAVPQPEFCKGESSSITFLPLQSVKDIAKKSRFNKFFDVVFFSNSMVHLLSGKLDVTFAPGCVVLCESADFMLDLTKDKKEEYAEKVKRMALSMNLKVPQAHNLQGGQHHFTFVL